MSLKYFYWIRINKASQNTLNYAYHNMNLIVSNLLYNIESGLKMAAVRGPT